MPDLTDTNTAGRPAFADLPPAEHALLWSMRVWVIGHCRQQKVSARICAALEDQGVEGSLPHLDAFMGALSRGAARPIELLCLCRTEVSDDERLLLEAFALCQRDDVDDAQALLSILLTGHAAEYAVRQAERVAHEFLDGGAVLCRDAALFAHTAAATPLRVLH